MINRIQLISWPIVLIMCATLGLAPFTPEPHIVEKLRLLLNGDLNTAVDIFDLIMHGSPFALALIKIISHSKTK